MARREFGSVSKLPSGKWRARYFRDGAWRSKNTFRTKADAVVWLAATQTDLDRGTWIDPAAGQETLSIYANRWLAGRTDLRPTTRNKYESLLRLHLLPDLGKRRLSRLTPSEVRAWYMPLRAAFESTGDDAYRLLRAIMRTTVADGLIAKSPCSVKGAGSVRSPERPVASVAEVAAAVGAAPEHYRAALLLCAWCQLRRGEVIALQRKDINLLHGTVHIERSRVPAGSAVVLGPPKTAAGVRTLAIPANVLPALQDHLDRFVRPEPDAWLFADPSGSPVSPRTLDRAWNDARKAIGRPELHLHDLRHSGLTWAAATGATTAELMKRGGHANPRAALGYQHATADRDRALADALAELAPVAPVVRLAK
jgi:integrase